MAPDADLITPLRRYWGYCTFRPLQERIVRSLLAGRDTCVVMPTGGGKSLCYQLPAVMSEKTAVVISPLIALMQDQAAQLAQMGIPAAVLNSTLSGEEQSRVMRKARAGGFRLLYLSPERLQRSDTLDWLQHVPVSFFAIDEAHCISEWGHEFRPEYRQLKRLRERFPERPIAAFTASATRHVRHDILAQLALRNPDKYIASFHRPNLRYLVRECDTKGQVSKLVAALRYYREGNVIVYSPTINRVEETVDFLAGEGIEAVPYHAKMEADDRRKNQERWMSDEVRVLVGTIAFGLGINKATVRAVIHLALPKSIEQFYQEAGRAGRDGNPADCVLLWRKQDAGILGYFANQISDSAERDRAWQRYFKIREFAESGRCRHLQICTHFGETPKWGECGACDICGSLPEWMTIGKSRAAVRKTAVASAASRPAPALEPDGELRDYLREWRRNMAKEQCMPAYVVLHDTTLEEICRNRPSSIAELMKTTGIGERKAELYGKEILAVLKQYAEGARASAIPQKLTAPGLETLELLKQGKTLEEIAEIRVRQLATVVNTVAALVESGQAEFHPTWIDRNRDALITAACERAGLDNLTRLKPVKDVLPPEITYEEIRLVLARMRKEREQKKAVPA
ncbi:MAG TPA: RecQ family ATP-dependent DNA helicase [Candidatus Sulfotelmatobacter sp.]|nr:RecQ family ATP-dependent DNA helicase [Candidatus Sulfotelmatobacter sp.]